MEKDVLISVKAISNNGKEKDKMEFLTKGKYDYNSNKTFITYEESELIGQSGVITRLYINEKNVISMTRAGEDQTNIVIEKGVRHNCNYTTVAGNMTIGVCSSKVKNQLSEDGGDISFKYSIDLNSSLVFENEIYMNIKECK